MQIQDYALGKMEYKTNLGYVKQGCGTSIRETALSFVGETEDMRFTTVWIALIFGLVFQMLFVWIMFLVPPKKLFKMWADKKSKDDYGYYEYGIFWGVSITAFLLLAILLYSYARSTITLVTERKNGTKAFTYILVALIFICFGGGVPIAIYRAKMTVVKLKVPGVYLWPAKLLCFKKVKAAEGLVITIALWVDITVLQLVLYHGIVTVVALSAAPFAMALNTVAIVLAFFTFVIFFSLIFTICGHLLPCKSNRQQNTREQENATVLENPINATPQENATVQENPINATPQENATVQENPINPTLQENATVQENPINPTLQENATVQESPINPTLQENATVQESPINPRLQENATEQENSINATLQENTCSTSQGGTSFKARVCSCCIHVEPSYKTMVLNALALLPLLLMIMCYGIAIAAMGSVINMETQKNNSISFIFAIITPIVLVSIPVFLQWFVAKWLKMSTEETEQATN